MKWMMSRKATDYSGCLVNGFTVMRRDESHDLNATMAHWLVKCEKCGAEKVVQSASIRNKVVGRCGCERLKLKNQSRIDLLVCKKQELRLKIRQIDKEIRAIRKEGKGE